MLLTQIIKGGVAPNFEVIVENDPACFQPVDTAHDDGLFELEARNTISQQAARAVMPVVNMDLIASHAHIFGGSEACGASADNADRLPA